MKRLSNRLTYANVMSTIAVFLVLGGASAFAATQLAKNTVGSKQLKKNAVTAAKIKNKAVTAAKIADGAVGESKIGDGAVTGAKVNESTLGPVPSAANAANAAALGGRPASEYPIRYFARVNGAPLPQLIGGSPGVKVDPARPFAGGVRIEFPADMDSCAIVGTPETSGPPIFLRNSVTSDGNVVLIVTEDKDGGLSNQAFSVVAVC